MAGVGLSYILNIMLIVHALRTGRPYYWIFIIMTPVIGPISYILVELLPEFLGDYRAKRAMKGIRRKLDPGADLRHHEKQNRISDSVDAKRHLAAELVNAERYDEAVDHYRNALTGIYQHDPDLMLGLATAQFGQAAYPQAKETLELLIEHNPEFKSPDGHLLYARIVEACGDIENALHEYESAAGTYPGPEASVRYAQLLERSDRQAQAQKVFEQVVDAAELAPRHFRKSQKEWINAAKEGVRRLRD